MKLQIEDNMWLYSKKYSKDIIIKSYIIQAENTVFLICQKNINCIWIYCKRRKIN